MNICYFGDFDPGYIRNDVIIEGLRQNGNNVILCHFRHKEKFKYLKLIFKYLSLRQKIDFIIVGSSDTSRGLVLLAKIITRKFLVWDAHYSIYDSYIFDRKLAPPKSLKAKYYWFLDWMGCVLADKILLDTNCHIKYFTQTFKMKESKFVRVIVGANESLLREGLKESLADEACFKVGFHGKFIPLQGIQYIVKAAKILEGHKDICFFILGDGQTYDEIRSLASSLSISNITFTDRVPYKMIPQFINDLDVSLGIFGDTDKAGRVIPNKLYEAIALGKPVITADTAATQELFEDRKNILLCKKSNAEDLANKILELKNNESLRIGIGKGAYDFFKEFCTPRVVGKQLISDLALN